jgi:Protein of unknown function (DUF1186)/SEC-C motif
LSAFRQSKLESYNVAMTETIKEIIAKIETYNGVFPKDELQILIDNKEEAIPFLLESLSDVKKLYERLEAEENYILPFYSLFLLAQFREKKAYPLVYEIFSYDAETVDDYWGDMITEDVGRILASTSNGDVSLINEIIRNEENYEYVRSAGLTAWLCLLRANLVTRSETITFLKSLFYLPPEEDETLRTWVVNTCLDIRAKELLPEIEKSFADGLVELSVQGDWEEFQALWKNNKVRYFEESPFFNLIDDTIEELSRWEYFKSEEQKQADAERWRQRARELGFDRPSKVTEKIVWETNDGTFQRETPKVGKNEPCPCGSGRKYKKCCLN